MTDKARVIGIVYTAAILGVGCSILPGGNLKIDIEESTEQGFTFLDQEKFSYAMGAFNDALDADSLHAPARYGLGLVFTETGYTDGARKQFRRAVEIDSTYGEAYLGLGRLFYDLGDFDESERHIRRAQRHGAGETAEALYLLGRFAERRGAFHEAESSFRESLDLRSENGTVRLALVDLLRRQGRYGDALDELERSEFPRGGDDSLKLRFADCRLHLGQDLEAERLLREIASRNRDWPEPRWGLAILALRRGDTADASEQLERYAALAPEGERSVMNQIAEALSTSTPLFAFRDRCRSVTAEADDSLRDRVTELLESTEEGTD